MEITILYHNSGSPVKVVLRVRVGLGYDVVSHEDCM